MTIKDKKIIKDAEENGTPIFVLTAKDLFAIDALDRYKNICQRERCKKSHVDGVIDRIKEFTIWKAKNDIKMKFPD